MIFYIVIKYSDLCSDILKIAIFSDSKKGLILMSGGGGLISMNHCKSEILRNQSFDFA